MGQTRREWREHDPAGDLRDADQTDRERGEPCAVSALEHAGLPGARDDVEASHAAFRALELLADPAWHAGLERPGRSTG